ncbi:MAG: hypothetical protein H6719_09810 [Sandaracinaceae bacterium]|nr:hypothetical protein [Sandaracinaceae bacterium]
MADEPLDLAGLPTFVDHEDQWGTSGYAWDGRHVVSWYEDRKEQTEGVSHRLEPERFLDGSASDAAKAWLRALL